MIRGGDKGVGETGTGTFYFSVLDGGFYAGDVGFRAVVCKASPIESVANEPELLEGMTPITFGDDGTPSDTEADNPNWYDYKSQGEYKTDNKTSKWANARTEDGSQWVWIPRYAYKIKSQPERDNEGIATEGGEIDIIFLKGTSDDTYIDKRGIEHKGLPEGYIVHPTFKDESSTNYANGGWDAELKGIWVAKYEAGYAGVGDVQSTTEKRESNLTYTSSDENVFGEVIPDQTKITYPVFVPNAVSYNYIGINDMFNLCKALNESNNPYGFKIYNADTHLMKNSEWGAVAYLTQSRYGRNGKEITQNRKNLNGTTPNRAHGATGYGDSSKYNTENGMLASTTGNMYGVYDLSGGGYEIVSGYLNNNNSYLTDYGKSLLNETQGTSTKYVSVYKVGTSDKSLDNYNESTNATRKGEAIWETSTHTSIYSGWFQDYTAFSNTSYPFMERGGYFSTTNSSSTGVFNFSTYFGNAFAVYAFRPVACKASPIESVPNAPELQKGMTPITYGDDGTPIDTEADNPEWYDYKSQGEYKTDNKTSRWANARTEDGSQWVWIPRYAYKILSQPERDEKNIASEGGEIDIIFLKDTSDDTYIDKRGIEHKGLPEGYIVHPAFKDETGEGYKNGGWDAELKGLWVAKYEAGYGGVGDVGSTTKKVDSPVYYSLSLNSGNPYGSVEKDITKLSYPVFVPNAYSYNYIDLNDAFKLCKSLNSTDNSYGFKSSDADTHLIKNSEWGAVAYLTQSRYGRNGVKVSQNNVNLNGNPRSINAVTGYGGTDKFNTENGMLASTTGNLYGVYDMNGGADEFSASFLNSSMKNSNSYIKSLLDEAGDVSTKYVSLYEPKPNGEYGGINNFAYSVNKNRVGEAIFETATSGGGAEITTSWFGGVSSFAWANTSNSTSHLSITRGGDYGVNSNSLFTFIDEDAGHDYHISFRPVVCKATPIESVANKPEILDGMTPITFEDNGTPSETNINDENWYNYESQGEYMTDGKTSKWANTKTEDGSQWVWIPRYAYKIISQPEDYKTSGGEIDIIFLNGTSNDTYIDKNGRTHKLPNGYIVHPAFTDESGTDFANGGWDEELTGIWVSKYEAGYAGAGEVAETTTKHESEISYSVTKKKSTVNVYGSIVQGETKIAYPVFVPNAYSFNFICVGDIYRISRELNKWNNPYGFKIYNADTHQMKNSEWGAVLYLTHSRYGRNGNLISRNTKKDSTNVGYGILGYGSGEEARYNTTEGKLASTTGNLYGIYDMSGGHYEFLAMYVNNGNENLQGYGKAIMDDTNGKSTKYVSVYKVGEEDTSSSNYNVEVNAKRKGEALWEISNENNILWFGNSGGLGFASGPFSVRGGVFSNTSNNAFNIHSAYGANDYDDGFRVVAVKIPEVTESEAVAKIVDGDKTVYYKTLQDAFNASSKDVNNPSDIYLLKGIDNKVATLENGYYANLHLQGFNLSSTSVSDNVIVNKGNLEIIGTGTLFANNNTAIDNLGNLKLTNCTVQTDTGAPSITNTGTIELNGTTVGNGYIGIYNNSTLSTIKVTDGTISGSTGIKTYGKVEILDGEVNGTIESAIDFVSGEVNITGGVINGGISNSIDNTQAGKELTIGVNDEEKPSITEPVINTGSGVIDNGEDKFIANFYDGCIKGEQNFADKEAVIVPDEYEIVENRNEDGVLVATLVEKRTESVPNKPELYTGMTPIKFNKENGNVIQTENTDIEWYSYESQGNYKTDGKTSRWANAETEDGSQWVWIPRYAYKIKSQPERNSEGIAEEGGEIDIIFLKDTTDDTYIDKEGNIHTGLPKGYIVHPAFKDESSTNYANGGWDEELTGIWVAKYEAGYAGVGEITNNTTKHDSEITYMGGKTNVYNNVYGEVKVGVTKITYPVFVPNAYSYNHIALSDIYKLNKCLNEKGNPYGFKSTDADAHMIKNSEWGAVAYLTQSKYGRNGNEVSRNARNVSNGFACGVTGHGSANTNDDKFNTEGGMLASSTGNLYGIYDMSGGHYELTSGYVNNGSPQLSSNGSPLLSETKDGLSTKYVSIYNDETNKKRVGEALWETAGWFGDYNSFGSSPFFKYGGTFNLDKESGVFSVIESLGDDTFDIGFRTALCKSSSVSKEDAVAQIGEKYYRTLQDAFDDSSRDVNSPSEILLLKECYGCKATLENGHYAKLNLQEYKIYNDEFFMNSIDDYVITNKGNLELTNTDKNGRIETEYDSEGYPTINNIGNLVISGAIISSTNANGIINTGTVEVKDGYVGSNKIAIDNVSTKSSVTVSGGEVSGNEHAVSVNGNLDVTNGKISSYDRGSTILVKNGNVNIIDGTVINITSSVCISGDESEYEKVVTIGTDDGEEPSTTTPAIDVVDGGGTGIDNVNSNLKVNFYDGYVRAVFPFENKETVNVPGGYEIVENTDERGSVIATLKAVQRYENAPQLLDGMTPIKFDENGNPQDTTVNDAKWYKYESQGDYKNDGRTSKWANARTEDGSQWVWIPRYAYKIISEPTDYATEGGEIDILFMKGTSSDTYYDSEGVEHTDGLPAGYVVHPAFTNESETNGYANGGWDEELEGIWVSKYEAGFAGVGEVQDTTVLKEGRFSFTTKYSNVYTKSNIELTKMPYPAFVPNAYSFNKITLNDATRLVGNMNETGNIYGFKAPGAETHLMKNSEWGAVAYLTQSKYGRNGIEVSRNKKNLNGNGDLSVYGVTGYGAGEDDKFNTEGGMLASSTGNLYGIYDLNGGTTEFVSAYIDSPSSDLTKYGKSLLNSSNYKQSKFVSMYNMSYDDDQKTNYLEENNSERIGEAIWETSTAGSGQTSWFGDSSIFFVGDYRFMRRGGSYSETSTDEDSGMFQFVSTDGKGYANLGFRAVLCKSNSKQVEYKPNEPVLASGMTPIKFDSEGNVVKTTKYDSSWYDYKDLTTPNEDNRESRWANAMTEDGSIWVWIPRFAYEVVSKSDDEDAGKINIIFLNGTSDTSIMSEDGINYVIANNNYKVHPAFKDESQNGFANGGWDSELTGIWVAKYEASESTTVNKAGKEYPKFVPNERQYGTITISDVFTLAKSLTESGNPYSLANTNIDSHLMKNSEWGAVAYLTHSSYGRNGNEVKQNMNLKTGYGGSSKYNTENGKLASSTGNLYGVYDLNGGDYEFVAGYLDNGNGSLTSYGNSLVSEAGGVSNKYISVYKVGASGDTRQNNYDENSSRIGEAIWETPGWFGDYLSFPGSSAPFMVRSGLAVSSGNEAGIFYLDSASGSSFASHGFRIILCNNDLIETEPNSPELLDGMTPITFDENGDSQPTTINDPNWYDYKSQGSYKVDGKTSHWANAETEDGSQWVWIPRFAYKITEDPRNIYIEGGKVDVLFLKDTTSDTYIDKNGKTYKGLPAGYIVHPAFTDESKTNYKNGGWNKELKGIWVAKYEAGFAQIGDVASTTTKVQTDILSGGSDTYDYIYGKLSPSTKLTYPVFVPNAYTYNGLTPSLTFELNKSLTKKNNPYGLNSANTDSHLMKNSEWGAIAYLTQSQYGRNGTNVSRKSI